MEIVPLNGYVLLREIKKTSDSSILVPDEADVERSNRCVVVKAGDSSSLAAGESVIILPHLFTDLEQEGEKYLIGEEKNIIARLS